MKKIKTKYWIIAGAALILATVIFLVIFFNRNVIVPEVTGESLPVATKMLNKAGLKLKTSSVYSDTILKDVVISQDKEGGVKAKYGTVITLIVSEGIEQITVPDLKDCPVEEAEETLKKLGFSVVINEKFSKAIAKGNVVDQSRPAGIQADKGSTIKLSVSKGPDLVSVPNVKGMSLEKAKQTLSDAGLSLKAESTIQFSNSVKEGYVISQGIEENKQVDRYSAVSVIISAGVANKVGTTPSNANNFGRVTKQGNWVYFTGSDRCIYRMRNDKGEIQRIGDYSAVSLNVVGEWIYYVDGTVGGIYKVRIDGTGNTKLSSVTSYKIYVDGEWIYYTSEYWGGKLYKMKTDGSLVTQIFSENCREYIVKGGYVYYTNSSDGLVYKCSIDGKSKTVLCAGFGGMRLSLVGKKLVVTNHYNVLSVNLDGSGFTSFGTTNVQYNLLNGYDGWVYYLKSDFRNGDAVVSVFGKMKPDGSQKTDIYEYNFLNHANSYMNVVDGWIYFQNEHDDDSLYRVKIDGTNFERVG